MEQNTDNAVGSQGSRTAKELVRPLDGRVLAGVARALANRYDIPLWVIRLIFVVATLADGLGLALYAAGWLLIRSEDEDEAPAQRFLEGASRPKAWVGIILIFIAAAILLDALTFVSAGVLWASGLLLVGVLLYTGHLEIPKRVSDDKEGVQQMTPTQQPTTEAEAGNSTGDSPAGGGTPPTPAQLPTTPTRSRSVLGRLTIGLMLLGVGVLAALDNIPAVPIDAQPRHYLALAVTILGIGLVVGSVWGRARWLILAGVVLVPNLLFSPAFEADWNADSFNLEARPQTFAQLEEVYRLEVGNMVIDLTQLDWNGEEVTVTARVDAGNIEIRIPNTVGIAGTATVGVGRVSVDGRESSGLGNPSLAFDEPGNLGMVTLDVRVDVGNITIDQ